MPAMTPWTIESTRSLRTPRSSCGAAESPPVETSRSVISRCLLAVMGLAWICLAATLCGCRPMSGYFMNESGKAYYQRGNFTAARMEFERALLDRPYNAHYAHNLASAMNQQGDVVAAEQMYRHALLLDPSHQPSYRSLAGLMIDQGREAEAFQLVQTWVETQPYTPDAHMEMSWLLQRQGNLAAAEQYAQQALQITPRNPRAMAQLGRVYSQGGRTAEAAALYRRSLAINPYQSGVKSEFGQIVTAGYHSPGLHMASVMPHVDPALQPGPMPMMAGGGWQQPGPRGPGVPFRHRAPALGGYPPASHLGLNSPPGMNHGLQTWTPSPGFSTTPNWNASPGMTVPTYMGGGTYQGVSPLPYGNAGQPVQLGPPVPTTMIQPGQIYSAEGSTLPVAPITSQWDPGLPLQATPMSYPAYPATPHPQETWVLPTQTTTPISTPMMVPSGAVSPMSMPTSSIPVPTSWGMTSSHPMPMTSPVSMPMSATPLTSSGSWTYPGSVPAAAGPSFGPTPAGTPPVVGYSQPLVPAF